MSSKGAKHHFSTQLLQVFDAVLICLAFGLASSLHGPVRLAFGLAEFEWQGLDGMMWVVFVVVPLTPLILERFGHYDRLMSKRRLESLGVLFRAFVVVFLLISVVAIFGKILDAKRLVLGMGMLFSFVLLWARSDFTLKYLRSRAKSDGFRERVILAGGQQEIDAFLAKVDEEVQDTWKVVAHFDLEEKTIEDLDHLIKSESVQRVIFLTIHVEFARVARAVETCEVQGVEAWIGASFLQAQVARPSFDALGGQPMLVFRSTPELSWQLFAKKLVDFFGALAILIVSSPFWLAAIIGIRLSSPGAPVIFTQQRSGLYGKPFRIYKFRTMVPDADKLLEAIKAEHGNEVDGPAFKLASDPRIFRFGHFLRKYSIDELPQMINVLKGEMSLVGPRPLPTHEIEAIEQSSHRRRLSMKPGVTCLWQISGRSDITDFDQWVKLDLTYIDRWSIWEDFRILIKTIPAVLFSKGAR